jgi:hypothetical protein
MKWTVVVWMCWWGMSLLAQDGARSTGMAGVSAMETGVWAVRNNPSGLSELEFFTAALASGSGFLVPGWHAHQLAAAAPLGIGGGGVVLAQEGWGDYRSGRLSLGYGLKLSEGFRLGWHADYLYRSVKQYFAESGLSFGIGVQAKVGEECWLAGYVQNPARLRWRNEEPLPALMRMALQWSPSEAVSLETELEYALSEAPRLRFGVEYAPGARVHLRLGAGSGPEILSFGFGYRAAPNLECEVAALWHWQLGWSPALGLVYAFGKGEEAISGK